MLLSRALLPCLRRVSWLLVRALRFASARLCFDRRLLGQAEVRGHRAHGTGDDHASKRAEFVLGRTGLCAVTWPPRLPAPVSIRAPRGPRRIRTCRAEPCATRLA